MMAATAPDERDLFKTVFKKYKQRDVALDLSAVVDVDKITEVTNKAAVRVEPSVPDVTPVHGLGAPQHWQIFHFIHHKGFYIIRNPFLPGYQRYWVSRCLQDLPQPPNVTNLRVHPKIDPHALWAHFVHHHQSGDAVLTSLKNQNKPKTMSLNEYTEGDYTPFPEDIGILAQYVAEVLGFRHFQAEAGIVNYYHLDSTLAGHTDHSELDHEAPLISVSFGQEAIFLLGGQTKATEPTAILLRSGDICVMSGPARLAYHAVPRILRPAKLAPPECFQMPTENDTEAAGLSERKTESSGDGCEQKCSCCKSAISRLRENDSDVCVAGDGVTERCCVCHHQQHAAVSTDSRDKDEAHTQNSYQFSELLSSDSVSTQSAYQETSTVPGDDAPNSEISVQNESVLSPASIRKKLVNEVNHRIVQTLQKLDWKPFEAYLSSSRINVNIRQVLKPGQTFQSRVPVEKETLESKKPRMEKLT